ncbi:SGNH/GDSL hydrolase family protein [uncultured Kordia sp.]|uniref:SGNH/GDSL hydrolase family protein n=1 Tax=uncultured Kordia sp. TaxID=507699 RepID=UPI00261AFDF4|nr:SGNH/GDSL hydrolase family protein [uncultured Kordia sp.]
MKRKQFFKKIIGFGISTFVFLVIAEIVLSFFSIFPNGYFTATPNSGFVWEIKPNDLDGISGKSTISFDALGARSTSNYAEKKHKIVALGGSTTACFALTQEKTWSNLLEKKLGDLYWIGNFGRPGNSSNHNVLQFEHLLKKTELEDVKTVLIMQGGNDFLGYLISAEKYTNQPKLETKKAAFKHLPNHDYPFHKRLTLYKLLKSAKQKLSFFFYKGSLTDKAIEIKEARQNATLVNTLPSLTVGLNHFEKNIQQIIDMAKQRNIEVVFMTQATLWQSGLAPELEKLLLLSGFQNNESFYSTEALSKGMNLFNKRLQNICKKNNVSCIDLATKLPKNTTVFYDDLHFNESGAKLVSDIVYTFLITNNFTK